MQQPLKLTSYLEKVHPRYTDFSLMYVYENLSTYPNGV